MKNKTLSHNQSQTLYASPTNNGTSLSNRNRNQTRHSDNRYSTVSKIGNNNNRDNEKDICNNNNNEEVSLEIDCPINNDKSEIIADSLNNNGVDKKNVEDSQTLSIDYSHDSNVNGNESLSNNDDDGNNTDHSLETDPSNVNTDEEGQKLLESSLENRTNLIVNYLPQNMTQEEMRGLFNNIGEVESCKLIRDKTTGQSLSYGFVNYQDPKDATIAIQQYNGLRLQNKMIKVSLARPSSETIKGANLYICGLPKSMSRSELEQLFSQYGTIITCRILADNVTGNSKGVAFIRFDQRQEAETAIKKLNGYTPTNGTEPITVKLANTPFNINNSSSSMSLSTGQLPMGHSQSIPDYCTSSPSNSASLPPSTGARCMMGPTVRPMATPCHSDIIPRLDVVIPNNGHPSPAVMPTDYGQPTGPVMSTNHQVPFPSGQIVCNPQMHPIATFPMSYSGGMQHPCLQTLHGPTGPTAVPNNSLVPVTNNHPSSQFMSIDPISASAHIIDSNLCCLLVYNLNPDTKESTLWQTFGPFGAVHSVNVPRDPVSGKCAGFGFVTMPDYHEAIVAATQLNGNSLGNQILQIVMNPGLKMPTRNQYVLPLLEP